MAKTLRVKCTFVIPVEVPDDDPDYDPYFDIEDNHCPGTGRIWQAIERHMMESGKTGTCWACSLGGTCEIVD